MLVALSALFTIFMSPLAILTPLQVARNFGPEYWRLSAIEILFAGGALLGGVLVGIWCFRNKIFAIGMASMVVGIMTILFGLWTNFIPYLVCMGLTGITVPYFNAPSMTLLQKKVDPDYLGRVMSVFTMFTSLAMPFGMLFFGPMADMVNINYILIGTGVIMVVLGALYFMIKTVREAGV
jgi:DHA3 family macrolide efflux protein-like MFS transporter